MVSIREIEKKLRELNSNNETKFGNIPAENLKQSSKNCSDILEKLFHDAMSNCHFSNIFDRLMGQQISFCTDQFLSPYVCSYRKSFSAEHALLSLIEIMNVGVR